MGKRTLSYRQALILATVFTFAGSLCSYFFAESLIKNFSGKGLVPENLIQSGRFVLSVALDAGLTVLLATRLGFPISITHGLVGALVGAGLVGAWGEVNFSTLGKTFFTSLIVCPVIAVILSSLIYLLFTRVRRKAGISIESCVCIGKKWMPVTVVSKNQDSFIALPVLQTEVNNMENCINQYQGKFLGLHFQTLINNLHYVSAGAVSFARGLNDKLPRHLTAAKDKNPPFRSLSRANERIAPLLPPGTGINLQ